MHRDAPHVARAHRLPQRALGALSALVVLGLCFGGPASRGPGNIASGWAEEVARPAGAAAQGVQEADHALRSPLAAVREATIGQLLLAADGRSAACVLVESRDARVRAGALEVLAQRAQAQDLGLLCRALSDEVPVVGLAAGTALLSYAARLDLCREPLLSAPLDAAARQALRHALLQRLRDVAPGEVPPELLVLGEQLTVVLADLLHDAQLPLSVRNQAATALGRLGNDAAVQALALALEASTPRSPMSDPVALLRALLDAQPEPGSPLLRPVDSWIGRQLEAHVRRAGGRMQGFLAGAREYAALVDWAHQYPVASWATVLREQLQGGLRGGRGGGGGPYQASLESRMRLFCSLEPPTDEELDLLIGSRWIRPPRREGRWSEQEGRALLVLEPYAQRPAAQSALRELLRNMQFQSSGNPDAETVQVVALYFLGAQPVEVLRARALALLGDLGSAAAVTQRSLALDLLIRLGGPDAQTLRSILREGELALRAKALPLALAILPPAEVQAFQREGLAHSDDGYFLVAAECARHRPLEGAAEARLEAMALGGRTGWRQRALGVLGRLSGAQGGVRGQALNADARRRIVFDLRSARQQPAGGAGQSLPSAGVR